MENNKFVFNVNSSDKEIKLLNDVLNGQTITPENSKEIADRVLKLSFIDQLHVLNKMFDLYDFSSNNKKDKDIEKFLSKKCFKSHRDIFINIFNDDDIQKVEQKYNIKIEIVRLEYYKSVCESW